MAAQDQTIRTNAIKAWIDKTSSDSICWLCKVKEETIHHLVNSSRKIAQTDHKERHDKIDKVDKVLQKEEVKILWDFKIHTDKHLAHNIPDITVVEKKSEYG